MVKFRSLLDVLRKEYIGIMQTLRTMKEVSFTAGDATADELL